MKFSYGWRSFCRCPGTPTSGSGGDETRDMKRDSGAGSAFVAGMICVGKRIVVQSAASHYARRPTDNHALERTGRTERSLLIERRSSAWPVVQC